jgi:mycoredoxin
MEQGKQGCKFVEQVNGGNRIIPTIIFPDGSILVEPQQSRYNFENRNDKI